jgi:hypothetical protein
MTAQHANLAFGLAFIWIGVTFLVFGVRLVVESTRGGQ